MDYRVAILMFCVVTSNVREVTSQEQHDLLLGTVSSGVQRVEVPMCKNLVPYTYTRLPNRYGHSTQVEVNRIIEHFWSFMDIGCSRNFRLFICSLYLPPYSNATDTVAVPCRETCIRAKNKCKSFMKRSRISWPQRSRCRQFPRGRQDDTCVKGYSERRRDNAPEYTYCANNPLPFCAGLPAGLTRVSLPNRFLQRNISEIEAEMQYYTSLRDSGCSHKLDFFLCGTFMPFCLPPSDPFSTPCREVCLEVKENCAPVHNVAYRGLPWPNKLQCHRFPSAEERPCARYEDYYGN